MPRPSRPRPRPASHRLRHAAALALSGTALAALVYVETVSAHDQDEVEQLAELTAELDESLDEADEEATTMAAASIPFAALEKAPPAAMAVLTAEVDLGTEKETPTPEVATITMPELRGMSLTRARRSLAKLGLTISARDTYGDKINRQWYADYRVRDQGIAAGTEVQPGTRVKVRARERYRPAMGY